jgi:hypothetical protein
MMVAIDAIDYYAFAQMACVGISDSLFIESRVFLGHLKLS